MAKLTNGHKVLRLYDNTRISEYKRCPRKFFYRHVLHWVPDGKSPALIFGGAWHAAMDVIWPRLTADPQTSRSALAKDAFAAFLTHWTAEGMPGLGEMDYEQEKQLAPRTPAQALEMIVAYIDYRSANIADFELVEVERPFAVPLDPDDDNLFYIGKIDKIVKRRGKILGLEHKTTTAYKKDGKFRSAFTDSFSPNSQVDGYLYALHMMFPHHVGGVWVDAALVHKQEEGFMFIPIERQIQHLDTWLWEVKWWIGQIEEQKALLEHITEKDGYMKAFPKNTNSCMDFATTCPYIIPCKAWPNPLGKEMPPDFTKSVWNPLEHVKGLENLGKNGKTAT